MSDLPTVSICTITYNREKFLEILYSQILNQNYPLNLIEWIIIDDSQNRSNLPFLGSNNKLKINYKYVQTKKNISEKRNYSHLFCNGEIIIYMDDDDIYPITRIMHAVEKLQGSEKLIAGCSSIPILFLQDKEIWSTGPFFENHACAASFAFKKKLLNLTSFNNNDIYGEEKYFLKNYSIPLIQLDPKKTILCLAHEKNTIEKRIMKWRPGIMRSKKLNINEREKERLKEVVKKYEAFLETSLPSLDTYKNKILDSLKPSWKFLNLERCFVINLPNSKERLKFIASHIKNIGLDLKRSEAISPNELDGTFISKNVPPFSNSTKLSVFISHLITLNRAINYSEDDFYLILEDDARLYPDPCSKKLDTILQNNNWDIIQLGTSNLLEQEKLLNFYKRGQLLCRWREPRWGAYGYLIKKEYAKKLVGKYFNGNSFEALNLNDVISLDLAANDMLLYQSGDSFTYTYPLAVPDYLFKSTNKNEQCIDPLMNIEHERLTYKLWIKNI
jgi:glycosyltransferase involved in cell wall biosynthesis